MVEPRPADPTKREPIGPGQTYVQTFDKPGTYSYICSIHPDRMHGTVVVTDAAP